MEATKSLTRQMNKVNKFTMDMDTKKNKEKIDLKYELNLHLFNEELLTAYKEIKKPIYWM